MRIALILIALLASSPAFAGIFDSVTKAPARRCP